MAEVSQARLIRQAPRTVRRTAKTVKRFHKQQAELEKSRHAAIRALSRIDNSVRLADFEDMTENEIVATLSGYTQIREPFDLRPGGSIGAVLLT